jgi:hypothetical protein
MQLSYTDTYVKQLKALAAYSFAVVENCRHFTMWTGRRDWPLRKHLDPQILRVLRNVDTEWARKRIGSRAV